MHLCQGVRNLHEAYREPDGSWKMASCLAVRQVGLHITQFYDRFLALAGLRTTQLSILAKLRRTGSMTINALATNLVVDPTTLRRTTRPIERADMHALARWYTIKALKRSTCHADARPLCFARRSRAMAASPSTPPRAIEVFYSYAHRDEALRTELDKHLSLLKRQGVIAGWHDRRITGWHRVGRGN